MSLAIVAAYFVLAQLSHVLNVQEIDIFQEARALPLAPTGSLETKQRTPVSLATFLFV